MVVPVSTVVVDVAIDTARGGTAPATADSAGATDGIVARLSVASAVETACFNMLPVAEGSAAAKSLYNSAQRWANVSAREVPAAPIFSAGLSNDVSLV